MDMKKRIVLALAILGIQVIPGSLVAQACIGMPQGSRGSLAFTLGFPEEAKSYGLSGFASTDEGNVFLGGSFAIATDEYEDVDNQKQVGGMLAFEIESLTPGASLCPIIGANYGWIEELNLWSVPFGVALGKTLTLEGGGTALTPYVMPQFIYNKVEIDDLTDSDWFFGFSAGATFSFTNFFMGGFVSKVFEEDFDEVFGIQVGMAWR